MPRLQTISPSAHNDDSRTAIGPLSRDVDPAPLQRALIKCEDQETSNHVLNPSPFTIVPYPGEDLKVVPVEKPFPFMKLPPELRQMVLKELLVQAHDIVIFNVSWQLEYSAKIRSLTDLSHRLSHWASHSPAETCQIFRVSKMCYNEAMPIYFGCNRFRFETLDLMSLLDKLKVDYRRNIKSLSINFWGHFPAKATRILRACTALRRLHLHISFRTLRYSNAGFFPVLKSSGINDLLKVRGIVELEVTKLEIPFIDMKMEGWEPFLEALQVLKQPYSAAAIRCQNTKDYPPDKAKRVVFGKANVVTRSERLLMNNSGEEQDEPNEQQ